MTERRAQVSVLSLLAYSALLPAVWLGFGTALNALGIGNSGGSRVGRLFTIVVVVVTLISWLFVRKHYRRFSRNELWQLVGYCALWAALCEVSALIYAVSVGLIPATDTRGITFAVLFALITDTLIIWLCFKYTGSRFIDWYLAKYPDGSPNDSRRSARLDGAISLQPNRVCACGGAGALLGHPLASPEWL